MIVSSYIKRKRKNRKIKFDEDRYVERYYIKDGIAVIPFELQNERDLYMKHDFLQMQLSDEVCSYIEEIAYMIPINDDINIEIHSPKLSTFKQEKIKKAIKNNYGMEIDDIEYDIRLLNIQSVILFIFGVLLLALNIVFDSLMGSIISNFLCVVWWVAIWYLVEIQIFNKVDLREKRLNYQQLYDCTVTFVFDLEKEESD